MAFSIVNLIIMVLISLYYHWQDGNCEDLVDCISQPFTNPEQKLYGTNALERYYKASIVGLLIAKLIHYIPIISIINFVLLQIVDKFTGYFTCNFCTQYILPCTQRTVVGMVSHKISIKKFGHNYFNQNSDILKSLL